MFQHRKNRQFMNTSILLRPVFTIFYDLLLLYLHSPITLSLPFPMTDNALKRHSSLR